MSSIEMSFIEMSSIEMSSIEMSLVAIGVSHHERGYRITNEGVASQTRMPKKKIIIFNAHKLT